MNLIKQVVPTFRQGQIPMTNVQQRKGMFFPATILRKIFPKKVYGDFERVKNLSQVSLRGANTAQTSNSVAKQCTERNQYPLYMDDKRNDNPLVSLVRNSRHLSNNYSFGYQAKSKRFLMVKKAMTIIRMITKEGTSTNPTTWDSNPASNRHKTDNNRIGSPESISKN